MISTDLQNNQKIVALISKMTANFLEISSLVWFTLDKCALKFDLVWKTCWYVWQIWFRDALLVALMWCEPWFTADCIWDALSQVYIYKLHTES